MMVQEATARGRITDPDDALNRLLDREHHVHRDGQRRGVPHAKSAHCKSMVVAMGRVPSPAAADSLQPSFPRRGPPAPAEGNIRIVTVSCPERKTNTRDQDAILALLGNHIALKNLETLALLSTSRQRGRPSTSTPAMPK